MDSERDCILSGIIAGTNTGACVLGEGACIITTEQECRLDLEGGFYDGVYCSDLDEVI